MGGGQSEGSTTRNPKKKVRALEADSGWRSCAGSLMGVLSESAPRREGQQQREKGELEFTTRPQSWSWVFAAPHLSLTNTGCPRKRPALGGPRVGWLSPPLKRIIPSPSHHQQLGIILQILRRLWVGQQSVHCSGSLGQSQTHLS